MTAGVQTPMWYLSSMSPGCLLVAGVMLSCCTAAADGADDFAEVLSGFDHCRTGDLFVSEYDNVAASGWLRALESQRCDREPTLATFCINQIYHGLQVDRLSVTKTTFPVTALHFDAPLAEARRVLRRSLGSEFQPSAQSARGERPELMGDPADPTRSILVCTKPF